MERGVKYNSRTKERKSGRGDQRALFNLYTQLMKRSADILLHLHIPQANIANRDGHRERLAARKRASVGRRLADVGDSI